MSSGTSIRPPSVREFQRAAWTLANAWLALWWAPWRSAGESGSGSERSSKGRFEHDFWRLRRAWDELEGEGGIEELMRGFRELTPERKEMEEAFLVWVNFLETLIQETERIHGPGGGSYKAQQVKAAILHLLLKSDLDMAGVPSFLEPILLEGIVEWSTEAIVRQLNRYDLWQTRGAGSSRFRPSRSFRAWAGLGKWFGERLDRLARGFILARHPLAPPLKIAVQELEKETRQALKPSREVLRWMIEHRRQLIAATHVVTVAVLEAEGFLELTGREKKEYVEDLVLAFLEDLGLEREIYGFWYPFIKQLVGLTIDAVVLLFRKRHPDWQKSPVTQQAGIEA